MASTPAVSSLPWTTGWRAGTGAPAPHARARPAQRARALDALAEQDAEPLHLVRFGAQVDVKGVLAGSPEAERCIGYLVKYLVKDLGDDLNPTDQLDDFDDDQADE